MSSRLDDLVHHVAHRADISRDVAERATRAVLDALGLSLSDDDPLADIPASRTQADSVASPNPHGPTKLSSGRPRRAR